MDHLCIFWVCRFKMQRGVSLVYTSTRIAKGQKIKLRFVRWSDLNYCMHNVESKHWIVNSLTTLGNGLVAYWLHFITVTRIPGKDFLMNESIILFTASKGLFHHGKKGTTGQSCIAGWPMWSWMRCSDGFLPPLHSIQASSRWGGPLQSVNSLEMRSQTYLEVHLHLLSTSEPSQVDSKD